jgi:hypothetical protein
LRDFDPAYDRFGSKTGKAQIEQMFSGLPPIADDPKPCRIVRVVPEAGGLGYVNGLM